MDYTNVLQALRDFCEKFQQTLENQSLIGADPWQSLLEELLGIQDLLNDPVISQPLDNHQLQQVHPVEKYGVASIVLALHEDGMQPKQIALHLQSQAVPVEESHIKSWLKQYSETSITQKAEAIYGSVFDTQTQLQQLFENLNSMIEAAKGQEDSHYLGAKITKEQVLLEHQKELRQLIKDAGALMTTVAGMQQVGQFQKIVIEEVNKLDPATAQRIWKRVREAKLAFTTLNL